MDIQTIQLFCCEDETKVNLCTPYSRGEYTFATNGHMQIRVPRLVEVPEREDAPIVVISESDPVGKNYLKEPAEWLPVPAVTVASEPCKQCGGTGSGVECPECKGDGYVELSTDFNDYDSPDCKTCNGTGQISAAGYERLKGRMLWLPESKPVTCDNCHTGQVWPMAGEIVGGVKINVRFLDLIGRLPGAQLGVFGELDVARFRFDGGDGLVMPMRQ